jgi:gliding motility-associated lipoprotein GldH
MKTRHKIGVLLLFIGVFYSCQKKVVFNQYVPIEKAKWENGQVIAIEIPMKDTISYYNLFINLRNTSDYKYSNLFLIARMTFPDNRQITDTLEYQMTDAKGKFLGSGFSDLKENKLFYKEKIRFSKPGNYLFEVKQSMRKRNEVEGIDPLEGVSDVGISVEKVK